MAVDDKARRHVLQPLADFVADEAQFTAAVRAVVARQVMAYLFARQGLRQRTAFRRRFPGLVFRRQQCRQLCFQRGGVGIHIFGEEVALKAGEGFSAAPEAKPVVQGDGLFQLPDMGRQGGDFRVSFLKRYFLLTQPLHRHFQADFRVGDGHQVVGSHGDNDTIKRPIISIKDVNYQLIILSFIHLQRVKSTPSTCCQSTPLISQANCSGVSDQTSSPARGQTK